MAAIRTTIRGNDSNRACAYVLACIVFTACWTMKFSARNARGMSLPCTVEKLGGNPRNNMYGAWYVCADLIAAPTTLISVGSGCDSTFEQAFLARYPGSAVHIFDPTISNARFQSCANSSAAATGQTVPHAGLTFWRVGLSNETKMVAFNKSPDPRIGSQSEVALPKYKPADASLELVVDLATLYTMLGVTTRPVLKIDIEGSEYRVIEGFCGHPAIERSLWPSQILIEFHDRLVGDGDGVSFGRLDAYACLRNAGYKLQYESLAKEEVLFALPV